MVQLLVDGLGGDVRRRPKSTASGADAQPRSAGPSLECYHVDCRLSDSIQDIGSMRLKKLALLAKYCRQAILCRWRHGVRNFYYIPAPGLRSAIYRDWLVMTLCRPFFKRVIFHWHAVGVGEWLETHGRPWERWITKRLLRQADLSITLAGLYVADVARFKPKKVLVLPNGLPDPCPRFEQEVRPRRRARAAFRAKIQAGLDAPAKEVTLAGEDARVFKIFYVGLCSREKGIFDLADAVALVNQTLRARQSPLGLRLVVAGKFWQAAEQAEFQQRLAQPDLQADVGGSARPVAEYCGYISDAEKKRYLLESDCFCFPTYYPMEGQPSTLLEAMAFDLPIITTRWRAIPELFPVDYEGLVSPKSPEQVARVLEKFMCEEFKLDFRRRFLEHYFETRYLERLKAEMLSLEPPLD